MKVSPHFYMKSIDTLVEDIYNLFNSNEITMDDADLKNNWTSSITTSWLYTKENLELLQDLFDAQALYPELFEYKNGKNARNYQNDKKQYSNGFWANNQCWLNRKRNGAGQVEWGMKAEMENSRFLHMNRLDDYEGADVNNPQTNFRTLGSDGNVEFTYDNGLAGVNKRSFNTSHISAPVFFHYYKKNHTLASSIGASSTCVPLYVMDTS